MLANAVIYARAGRIRVKIPKLTGNQRLARKLEYELLGRSSISSVHASSITGNILIHYQKAVSQADLLSAVDEALRIATSANPPSDPLWCGTVFDALLFLDASRDGLTSEEVARRQQRFGKNIQRLPPRDSDLLLFGSQFKSLPAVLLCTSAVISLATGGLVDAGLVGAVVLANAVIGFFSERTARRIIGSLVNDRHQFATTRRDGSLIEVAAEEIVPGDVLMLEPGNMLPADTRIIESDGLLVDESLLTGESEPVAKQVSPLDDPHRPLAERFNMAFGGTTVVAGTGIVLVVATGFATEIGRITLAVTETRREQTPMQMQIDHLGRQLSIMSVAAGGAAFGLGFLRGTPFFDLVRGSTALAVAAFPEGLPVVATSILATGLQYARQRDVLIRTLGAVETLGSVSIMCFDKTGTLTQNRMDVACIAVNHHRIEVDDQFMLDGASMRPETCYPLMELLRVAALCNESQVEPDAITGSATENALLLTAIHAGIDVTTLRRDHPLLSLERRSETQRYMRTVHDLGDDRYFSAWKGNPLDLLSLCSEYLDGSGIHALDPDHVASVQAENATMTEAGLRVLGLAYAHENGSAPIWLGMIGMTDPARPDMAQVIHRFHQAGIRTLMVTGDQIGTARAVAEAVRLAPQVRAIDCARTDTLPDELRSLDVLARVTPLQKLAVVQQLRDAGDVVAMIGDGINDGPALRAADVGVTFGMEGTDTARNIADVVLLRDDLAMMEVAVQQGRGIYENIRKAIQFLVGTNSSEVMLAVSATALGAGQPLNTIQLLWINLVTDVAIALALGHEQPHSDVMQTPPRPRATPLVEPDDYRRLLKKGSLFTASAFAAHLYGMARYGATGGGVGMLTLLSSQLLDGFSSRSRVTPAWDMPRNPFLSRSIFGLIALQVAASLFPPARALLGIAPLTLADAAVITAGSVIPFLAIEATKPDARSPKAVSIRKIVDEKRG